MSKLTKQTIYSLDVQLPTLGYNKTVTLNDKQLAEACREVEDLYNLLAEERGSIPTPKRGPYNRGLGDVAAKVLEYARTHDEFTMQCLSNDLKLPVKKLYSPIASLVDKKQLVREQVGAGLASTLRLTPSARIEIGGKQPLTKTDSHNPEKERMESR